ncbi:MAG TPA: gliding motility-associated C-terminal domain-containing protein, partial [Saprospiraceae bacterium]|nr:gliding motility-associated C-terminal domain-containing protein [Saprospiraceae bacterium]
PGQYNFSLTRGICTLNGSTIVNLVNIPDPNLQDFVELCEGDRLTLEAPSYDGGIRWSNGVIDQKINIRNGGVYKLTLSANGCMREDSTVVNLVNCDGEVVFFPNVISPRQNSIDNQFFGPTVDENFEVTSYELNIYDRQGSLVYSTSDLNGLWEGKLNNSDLQNGVYTYIC